MRLLLDEMISPRIARELRDIGHDVQAVKKDRPDLVGRSDRELVRLVGVEGRVIVTNDIADLQAIHAQRMGSGGEHHGMVFTLDATMPRSKRSILQWVTALGELIESYNDGDSLRNRVHHLL